MSDPGASLVRTRLAWRRTGLSASIVPLLAARPAFAPGAGAVAVVATASAMIGWAVLVGLAYRRSGTLDRPGGRAIVGCAALTVAFAAIGGMVVVF